MSRTKTPRQHKRGAPKDGSPPDEHLLDQALREADDLTSKADPSLARVSRLRTSLARRRRQPTAPVRDE